tara:strand:- start:1612 stop:1818 length:207 start_codon:yes stop_codon:yes gene_type:complete
MAELMGWVSQRPQVFLNRIRDYNFDTGYLNKSNFILGIQSLIVTTSANEKFDNIQIMTTTLKSDFDHQ